MTNIQGSRKEADKATRNRAGRKTRKPPIVEAPSKLTSFMRLANLIPSFLRRATSSTRKLTEESQRALACFTSVKDFWDTRTDEGALGAIFWLRGVVDRLPVELQAFILHDDDGRLLKPGEGGFYDPEHCQRYNNITLLQRPEKELQLIVAAAQERVENEIKTAQAKVSSRTAQLISGRRTERFNVGSDDFVNVGIAYLADRARQRLFFALSAEETLAALAESTEETINDKFQRAEYPEKSGALTTALFVEGDRVQLRPPLLFQFTDGVQVSRIRLCAVCENYFWAGRKDKKVCSEPCAATRRKRKQRGWYETEGKWKSWQRELNKTQKKKRTGPARKR